MRNLRVTAPCGARVAQQLGLPCTLCLPGQLQRVWELGHASFGMVALPWWLRDSGLAMVALGCSSSSSTLQDKQHMLGFDLPRSQFLEKGKNWKTGLVLPPSSLKGLGIWFLGPDLGCAAPCRSCLPQ